MRTRFGTVLAAAMIAGVALVIGGVAGWFAAGAWGNCGNVELCNCGNVETANDGRARSPSAPNEKARPRRRALIRSSSESEVQKRILSDAALEVGFLCKEEEAVLNWLSAEKRAREMGCSNEEASTIAYALRDYDYITRIVF